VAPNLAQLIPQEQPNHTLSLGHARSAVKQWLRKAKLQPFNRTLSDMAALIKENSSPFVQRVNSWRLWASKHGFPVLAIVAVRLQCMHPTACASEHTWSVWGQLYTKRRSRLALERVLKLICICCSKRTSLRTIWSPACSPLPKKMNSRISRIEQLG